MKRWHHEARQAPPAPRGHLVRPRVPDQPAGWVVGYGVHGGVERMPIALDMFCGLGGWAEGLLAAGWDVIGIDFDQRFIGRYLGQLVIHDVLNFCGRKMRGKVSLVVASPDCREPSYRAMPWKRAKALNEAGPPHNFIRLFNRCFEIADEIGCPVIVENVVGAQRWVGRAKWHYGSFYLWGDVPALMPRPRNAVKVASRHGRRTDVGKGARFTTRDCGVEAADGRKGFTKRFEDMPMAWFGSKSPARREASAQIAKIPFDLAYYIGKTFLD